jgi:DHA1 family multidrug resistance protein-like MFS transporter
VSGNSGSKEESHHNESPTSWRSNLYVLWLAEFIAIVAFSVITPILPLYVKELGVQGEKQARLWSGLVFSAHGMTMVISAPVWGALSDRHGRKLMVERAMFGGAAIMGLMTLAQNVQQLALLRALQGLLTGTVTAANALVATTAPPEHAGYAMGSLQMAVYLGASVGPLLGGVVADILGFRAAFILTSALLLVAALAVLRFVREPDLPGVLSGSNRTRETRSRVSLSSRAQSTLSPVLGSALVLGLLSVRLLMRLAVRLPMATLPLFVEMIAPPGTRVATVTGLIIGFSALAGAVGGRRLGRLSDRVGYRSILIVCAAASVVFYLPQSIVERPIWLIVLQAGAGLAMGGIVASVSAALATAAPEGRQGIIYGVDASVVSVANAIGPMTGSLMAAYFGLRSPFLAAATVFALAGVLALRLLPAR